MVTVPTYPPVRQPTVWNDWMNSIEDFKNGFTASGNFIPPFTYLIGKTAGGDYYANNAYQTIYGGAGDAGGVDGASAIAVINAALADFGSIVLKANTTFPLTAKLEIDETLNYVSIRGEGKSTVLQCACNDDLIYILGDVPPGTAVHLTLSGLTLDGNKAAYPAAKNALYIKHSMYGTYENLWIKNAVEDGIHFESAQRSIFNNIFVESCDGEGIHFLNVGGETMLSNIWIIWSGLNGMLLDSANYVQGSNIHSVGNGDNGVKFDKTGIYVCSFNTFSNLHCLCNQDNGIYARQTFMLNLENAVCYDDQVGITQDVGIVMDGTTGTLLSNCIMRRSVNYGLHEIGGNDAFQVLGCTIAGNKKHGVLMTSATNGIIGGCVIRDNDEDNTATYDGINLSGCSYLIINNNRIQDNDRYGINISADTSAVLITGNNLISVDSVGAINNLADSSVVIHHNIGGYDTENRGIETGTGAQQTIVHALMSTPYTVSVVPVETGVSVTNVWADATNVYCTVTAGKVYRWSAEAY